MEFIKNRVIEKCKNYKQINRKNIDEAVDKLTFIDYNFSSIVACKS